ncbi:MAG: hypothetical protein ABIQ09_08735 [Jatrophihabitantaceae bacterium]
MLLDRRSALAAALLGLSLTGCSSWQSSSSQEQATSPAAAAPSASLSAPQSSTGNSSSPRSSPASGSVGSTPAAKPTAPHSSASAINVGPSLCSGADVAQNTADAYMGALSAADAQQAMACVLPNTVPAALTRSLLAHATTTAVYLPRDGVNGPAVFGYRGGGKLIDVTVSKQPNGQFWVTKVAVRSG